MNSGDTEITSVTVSLTLELFDLGTFSSGAMFVHAQNSAALRLGQLLGIEIDPKNLKVEAISSKTGTTTSKIESSALARQRDKHERKAK